MSIIWYIAASIFGIFGVIILDLDYMIACLLCVIIAKMSEIMGE